MIAKSIEGSITKIYLKTLGIFVGDYEWADNGGLIRNDGPTMLYLPLKIINFDTSIGFSDLKDEVYIGTLAKFGTNAKYFIEEIP